SGVGHVGDEEVEIQHLGGCERAVVLVREQPVVLGDGTQRPGRRELVVPLGPDDVVVERGVLCGPVQYPIEDVGVIDFQALGRLQGHGSVHREFIAGDRQLSGGNIDQDNAVANNLGVEGKAAERTALDDKTDRVLNVGVIRGQTTEIGGAECVGFVRDDRRDDQIRLKVKNPIEAVRLHQVEPGMVPVPVCFAFGAVEDKVPAFRTPIKVGVLAEVPKVGSRNKTGLSVEAGGDVLVHEFVGEAASDAIKNSLGVASEHVWAGGAGTGGCGIQGELRGKSGGTEDGSEPGCPILIQPEVGVESADAVIEAGKFAVGEDCADTVLLSKIVTDATYSEVSAFPGKRAVVGNHQARRTVVGDEETEIPRALFSREARTEGRIGNTPREQHLGQIEDSNAGIAKIIRVLQEEWALFRKENLEALIDKILRLIGFDLSEVGIDSGVEDETVVKDKFGIEAHFSPSVDLLESRLCWIAVIDGAEVPERNIGVELHVAAGRNVLHAAHGAFLIKYTRDAARDVRPVIGFIIVGDVAHKCDTPQFIFRNCK